MSLHVAIIGAGIAGCSAAEALTRRGVRVTIIDRQYAAGSETSAHTQAVLFSRLPADGGAAGAARRAAWIYSSAWIREIMGEGSWSRCGTLLVAHSAREQRRQDRFAPLLAAHGGEALDRAQASQRAGISLPAGGHFFQAGGWADMGAVCRAALHRASVSGSLQSLWGEHLYRIEPREPGWSLLDINDKQIVHADAVVIASSHDTSRLIRWLPLHRARGQVTRAPALAGPKREINISTVICGDGYITPAHGGYHTIGASFQLGDPDMRPRTADDVQNIARLRGWLVALPEDITPSLPWVDARCTTEDALPVVGAVPDLDLFTAHMAPLRHGRKVGEPAHSLFTPGLFVLTGLGARGMVMGPWCAELLAEQICEGGTLPGVLAPERFITRAIRRNLPI